MRWIFPDGRQLDSGSRPWSMEPAGANWPGMIRFTVYMEDPKSQVTVDLYAGGDAEMHQMLADMRGSVLAGVPTINIQKPPKRGL